MLGKEKKMLVYERMKKAASRLSSVIDQEQGKEKDVARLQSQGRAISQHLRLSQGKWRKEIKQRRQKNINHL